MHFFYNKICIYQKKAVPLHRNLIIMFNKIKFTIMITNFSCNDDLLIQLECHFSNEGKNVYQVVTFLRHSHDVLKSDVFKHYEQAYKLYDKLSKSK